MAWLQSTTTTDKGPLLVCINLDHVSVIRPTSDGRTNVFMIEERNFILDDTYVTVIQKVIPATPPPTNPSARAEPRKAF